MVFLYPDFPLLSSGVLPLAAMLLHCQSPLATNSKGRTLFRTTAWLPTGFPRPATREFNDGTG